MTATAVEPVEPAEPVAASGDVRRREPGLRGRILGRVALGALVGAVLVLQGWHTADYPFPNDDEGAYISQAWAILHGELAHYTYWYDHPPFGWMQLAVLWGPVGLMAPGLSALAAGRIAMLAVTAMTLLLVHLVARRLDMPRWAALLAVALTGLSPLALALHRQVYLDNFAVLWLLAGFALALSPRRNLGQHIAAGIAVGLAVLSKETIAPAAVAVFVALWQQGSHSDTRRFSIAGFVSGTALSILVYPLWAMLKGELFPGEGHVSLLGTLAFQLHGRAGTGSAFVAGTEAHDLVASWLRDDPFLLIGGTCAAVAGLLVRSARPPALAAVVLVLVGLRPTGYLPKMYVVQLLPFLALALAGLAAAAHARAVRGDRQSRAGVAGRAVAVLAVVALLLAGLFAVPRWVAGDRAVLRASTNDGYAAAAVWIRTELRGQPGRRVVSDGVLWVDLVRAGYEPGPGAIWHYKIDLDPAVQATLPNGWRDIDYVISTPAVRGERKNLPTLAAALDNSDVIKTFGTGGGRIEVRRVRDR